MTGSRTPQFARAHVATVVVSDLRGSTALAERLDPESLREALGRYFDEMRVVLEAHGGSIEKVIGDAIVAVFGLDDPDDDGAWRAVAAAAESRGVLATLNNHLERRWGVRLVNRTGVCTGEVLIGSAAGDRVITGEAIEVATRMEQTAPPTQVQLAAPTARAVADRVETEPLGDIEIPGRDPVPGLRLAGVSAEAAEHLAAAPREGPGDRGARRETRRTVTIVFADARPETAATPEAIGTAMSRYFAVVRGILERHGGTVERYIGDAVMAVFGLERRREDDAARAVRAAVEMQEAMEALNAGLAEAGTPRLRQHIGVNTGNLVAGDGADRQRLVTGDAVNVAARLEQAAAAGEVLMGAGTAALAAEAVLAEPVEPLSLKGKAEPVPAFRVTGLAAPASRRPGADTPMVGRVEELRRLRQLLTAAIATRAPRMAVVIGDAGVGKSRLTAEIQAEAEARGVLVLEGHCRSYGEGITFWPVLEVVHQAAGISATDSAAEARARLDALMAGDADAAARLASLIGLDPVAFPLSELFWGVRRMLEALGRVQPVLMQVDDLHWAEPTLIELLDHLAGADDLPLLVLATARQEVRERAPEVLASRELIELAPLGEAEAVQMVDDALGEGIPRTVRDRIVRAGSGNPLFVEQLVSMLVDTGRLVRAGAGWRVVGDLSDLAIPPSVEALVAARVDELPDGPRLVLEPAAVVGQEFAADAVSALAAPSVAPQVPEYLGALAGYRMVGAIPEPDGLFDHAFIHPMIRDVAYGGLLKRTRADLHERFVAWAEEHGAAGDRAAEVEEILGYHLEQAHRCRADLGPLDAEGVALGRRAAERLSSAGRRALERGDMPAAANLLRRAAESLPEDDPASARLLVQVGQAEMEVGRFSDADATLERAAERAAALGDTGLASVARLERTRLAYNTGAGASDEEVAAQAEGAIYAFTGDGDDEGLATAWRLLLNVRLTECRFGAAEQAAQRIVDHAGRAGNRLLANRMQPVLALLSLRGPTPVYEGVARCGRILAEVEGDRQAEAIVRRALAHLRAMRGELDAARAECRRCREELEGLGWMMDAALVSLDAGPIALLADDPAGAEAELRRDMATLEAMGERNYISTTSALLAEALYRQDRLDEAREVAAYSRGVVQEGDVATHIILDAVEGKLRTRDGDPRGGVEAVERAVALAAQTDDRVTRGDTLVDLAEALRMAGDRDGARGALHRAREEYRTKGDLVALWRVSRLLEALRRRR